MSRIHNTGRKGYEEENDVSLGKKLLRRKREEEGKRGEDRSIMPCSSPRERKIEKGRMKRKENWV
jgi:hypothetical protein